jgi:hypothetical protein
LTSFRAGDVAVLRYLWYGRPFWSLPTRVVEDGAERTVLWVAPGTRYRRPGHRLTMAEIAANEWTPVEHPWTGNGTLMISRPAEPYSLWLFWNEGGEHASWYVNLELPWQRTELGFDSRDHQLDIVVRADRSWQWKDEDELRRRGRRTAHRRRGGRHPSGRRAGRRAARPVAADRIRELAARYAEAPE